jgi:ribosomal protein S18 acetylase RimI-like enzyme
MTIDYREDKDIDASQLQDLFLALKWDSGNYPEKLHSAFAGSDRVFSAWEGDRLVGLVSAISDGSMTAYIPYLVVHPEYQNRGIGRALLTHMLDHYSDCAKKVLTSFDHAVDFYKQFGFEVEEGQTPMIITDLKPPP